jgi:ribosome biogenesis GTPase
MLSTRPIDALAELPPSLEDYGWRPIFATAFDTALTASGRQLRPARVLTEFRGGYNVHTGTAEVTASVAGRLRHHAEDAAAFPAVGDWVAVEIPHYGEAKIHAVLPRVSTFSRRGAGKQPTEQVLAANVDTVLLVSGLDHDFNPRRMERYLALAWASGAAPVIVLNKADLCEDVPAHLDAVREIAPDVPIHVVSGVTRRGIEELRVYAASGMTVAFLGSSGVGKSTLVNALLGTERQATGAVREDDARGRHTTIARQLLRLPGGGLLIDTPGMRELQLWDAADGLDDVFADIRSLAEQCRFADCAHRDEPGCAVQLALADGALDRTRFVSQQKLEREMAALERKRSEGASRHEARQKARASHRLSRDAMAAKRARNGR